MKNRPESADEYLHVAELKASAAAYSLACYSCQAGDRKAAQTWLERAIDRGGGKLKLVALDNKELEPLWVLANMCAEAGAE